MADIHGEYEIIEGSEFVAKHRDSYPINWEGVMSGTTRLAKGESRHTGLVQLAHRIGAGGVSGWRLLFWDDVTQRLDSTITRGWPLDGVAAPNLLLLLRLFPEPSEVSGEPVMRHYRLNTSGLVEV